jgi:MFS family permease
MVMALGIAWILDGLEITLAADVADILEKKSTLAMSPRAVGDIASVYLIGEVFGAIIFGRLSDKLGRKKLFLVTLGVYLIGSGLTAATFGHGAGWVTFLYATRFIAGMGIGGEYAAINSAIDEMIPAHYRGRVDIAINGTYWGGALIGTIAEYYILNHFGDTVNWRHRLSHRAGLGIGRDLRATKSSRESAMADHARSRKRSRRGDDPH